MTTGWQKCPRPRQPWTNRRPANKRSRSEAPELIDEQYGIATSAGRRSRPWPCPRRRRRLVGPWVPGQVRFFTRSQSDRRAVPDFHAFVVCGRRAVGAGGPLAIGLALDQYADRGPDAVFGRRRAD